MSDIGHNLPPDMAETAISTSGDLSVWMAEHPVIQNEEEAREAKLFIDRGALCVKDLEDERKSKTAPLNEQVEAINRHYRAPRNLIQGVVDELKYRFDAFLHKEEERRQRAAEEAQRIADEAERLARDAESREKEQIENAVCGEVGVDIAGAIADADQRFAEFERAARKAAIAERETKVKIGGGFRRALSLRNKDIIVIVDPYAAMKDIGLTEDIAEAIVKSARAFKKLHGKWPEGLRIETERKS